MRIPRLDHTPINLFEHRAPALGRLSAASLLLLWVATALWPLHTPPFSFWQQNLLAVLLGLGIAAPLLRSKETIQNMRLLVVPLTLAALLLLGRGRLDDSLIWALLLAWASVLFLSAQVARQAILKALPWWLARVALINAAIGVWQMAIAHAPFAVGALAQRNLFADVQTLGFVALLFLPIRRPVARALALILALSIAASGSAAALVYAVWIVSIGAYHKDKRLLNGGLQLLAVLLGWRMVGLLAPHALSQHVPAPETFASLWAPALHTIWHHPLGVGVGHVAQVYYAAAVTDPAGSVLRGPQLFDNAHNLFLQIGLVSGLPGMLAVAWLGWAFLRRALRAEHVLASTLLGVLWIHSLVEFPLWQTGFLALFAVLYGVSETPSSVQKRIGDGVLLLSGGLAAAVVLLAGLAVQMHDVEAAFSPFPTRLADARNTKALQAWFEASSPSALLLRGPTALALARKSPLLVLEPQTWPSEKRILDAAFNAYPAESVPLERATVWALLRATPPAQIKRMAHQAICARPVAAAQLLPVVHRFAGRIPVLAPVESAAADPCSVPVHGAIPKIR